MGVEQVRTIAEWMVDRATGLETLVETSGLDRKVVDAIVHNRYTPSPQQRQRLAQALGVDAEQIAWGHASPVQHIYGHGPQFGRSP